MAVVITQVKKGSAAHRAGVRAGDTLLCVDNEPISDLLDYQFYTTSGQFQLLLSRGEREFSAKIKKDEYEDLGLGFESYLMDEQRSCKNHCIFCFIDQNPKGMRESVYFKDDDDRLSFLFGNYITLTNLSEHDLARILRMHISPVNVSVHTTDERLRVKMMRNPNAGSALSKLRRLAEGGVRLNTQLVLCPGVNDGAALDRTLGDLGALYPAVQSIACVPVGLTGHREGLYALSPFTKEGAQRVIEQVESFSSRWLAERGERVAYPADEFFLKAGLPMPPAKYYGEFAQLENGVGLLALCKEEFSDALETIKPSRAPRRLTAVTGEAAFDTIKALAGRARAADNALDVQVEAVKSRFFGGHITVTGLVCGSDIADALAGRSLGDALLVPSVMLRHEQDRFLDDMSVHELSKRLGVAVRIVPATGGGLARALLGAKEMM